MFHTSTLILALFDIELPAIIAIVALVVLAVVFIVIAATAKSKLFDSRSLAYAAVCIALSFVLSYIKLEFAYGGSITLASCIPLILYAYAFGTKRGLLAGFVYALLQFIQAPWAYHVVQVLLDYPLPFMAICMPGLFRKILGDRKLALWLGLIAYYVLRLACHVGSGIYFFNMGWVSQLPFFGSVEASAELGAFTYSFLYNVFYIVPDAVIAAIVLFIMQQTKATERLLNVIEKK